MVGNYEVVIGLEIHVQLSTNSKIFCSCSAQFGSEANSQVCPVCSGMPGALPVLNKKALQYIIKAGLATNCDINQNTVFARKNYFYPDLPKGYQISQFDLPVCEKGFVEIFPEDKPSRKIRLTRIHLEEDAGKSLHPEKDNVITESYIDLNRCGTPLIEIVTEPDMRSPEEAYLFLTNLKQIISYLDISDCNMEEGSLRCDANISLRPVGTEKLGTKTELKNMNSFHGVEKALQYEIRRQEAVLDSGEKIEQQTLLWDDSRQEVRPMRSKEESHDYRYFPDPDLVPVVISDDQVNEIRESLPELPGEKTARFREQYNQSEYNANLLCSSLDIANYFEDAVKCFNDPESIAKWVIGDITRLSKETKQEFKDLAITPEMIAELVKLVSDGKINGKIAKTVFKKMVETGDEPSRIIEKEGLVQVTDTKEIESIVDGILEKHPNEIEQYLSGKDKVLGFFVGQVMKASKGKANPQIVNQLLKKKLKRES